MNKQGFIQTVYTESAEAYEAHTLETLLKDVNSKEVLADKAYDTADNRNLLKVEISKIVYCEKLLETNQ